MLLPYLAEHPPAHILLAGLAGFKRPQAAVPAKAGAQDLAEWRAVLGAGDVHAGLREGVILDFNRLRAASKRSV